MCLIVWCSVLVLVYVLSWCSGLSRCGVCVIIYYTLYYILYILYIILYLILSSSSVLIHSLSPLSLLFLLLFSFFISHSSFPIFILYLSVLTYGYLYSILFSSSLPLPSFLISSDLSPLPPPHSFYTCRYLHILIYIPDSSSSSKSDPARSIGVDG